VGIEVPEESSQRLALDNDIGKIREVDSTTINMTNATEKCLVVLFNKS